MSRQELEKALNKSGETPAHSQLHKMKGADRDHLRLRGFEEPHRNPEVASSRAGHKFPSSGQAFRVWPTRSTKLCRKSLEKHPPRSLTDDTPANIEEHRNQFCNNRHSVGPMLSS